MNLCIYIFMFCILYLSRISYIQIPGYIQRVYNNKSAVDRDNFIISKQITIICITFNI